MRKESSEKRKTPKRTGMQQKCLDLDIAGGVSGGLAGLMFVRREGEWASGARA